MQKGLFCYYDLRSMNEYLRKQQEEIEALKEELARWKLLASDGRSA